MQQIILVMAAFGLMVVAFKVAMIFLITWGLIFRTKETLGLLIVAGILSAFQAHPWITTGVVAGLCSIGYYLKRKERRDDCEAVSLPAPASRVLSD